MMITPSLRSKRPYVFLGKGKPTEINRDRRAKERVSLADLDGFLGFPFPKNA